jgi:hypothetical protein
MTYFASLMIQFTYLVSFMIPVAEPYFFRGRSRKVLQLGINIEQNNCANFSQKGGGTEDEL